MKYHFAVECFYCLGMTDIDDKIIKKGWERGLVEKPWEEYAALARSYEKEFWEDMDALNVLRPTAVTRVSEHIDDIIAYITRILEKGNAYVVDGSGVYFSTSSLGHRYCRLGTNKDLSSTDSLVDEAEPAQSGKKDHKDFALWKCAKPGEPYWSSPWGNGRPGWHIECSAMTHAVFGSSFDLHTGGVDLQFPHHTNEIAQCEAHNGTSDWVKYWLHTGHLHIEGLKMSKSLKNFITIREFLKENSADEFRMFCLQFKYNTNINFSHDRLLEAKASLNRFINFISLSKAQIDELDHSSTSSRRWGSSERALHDKVQETEAQVKQALGNDFDTPSALGHLDALVSTVYDYLKHSKPECTPPEPAMGAVELVSSTLKSFGLKLDFLDSKTTQTPGSGEQAKIPSSSQLVELLATFRADVRSTALTNTTDPPTKTALLQLCDDLRNKHLPALGIELTDLPNKKHHWKAIK